MIRVSEPMVGELEKKYLCEAIDAGEISSMGSFVRRFEEAFAKWSGNDYAVMVSSGTAALETAIWALELKEISIPDSTIISCYLAAERAGARIFLRDNKPVHFNKTPIMRCHLFGELERSTSITVIDDNSQYWKPFRVQDAGVYSLFSNKLITSGEGGVIVTNWKDVYQRAQSYRNLCHSKERFIHNEVGYNFRATNMQAAVALAQLEQIEKFTEIKQRNRDLYLKNLPEKVEPLFNVEVPWMYLIKTPFNAGEVVDAMNARGIECRRNFYPLHRQPCLKLNLKPFPIADESWNKTFYLPSGTKLTEKDIHDVCTALRQVLRDFESKEAL